MLRTKKSPSSPGPSPQSPDPNQRWLNVELSAQHVDVCPQVIRDLIRSGELRAVKLGKGYKIDRADLDELMLRRKRTFPPYRVNTHPWVAARHAKNRKRSVAR
jgi:excisionase family DNA binding protein